MKIFSALKNIFAKQMVLGSIHASVGAVTATVVVSVAALGGAGYAGYTVLTSGAEPASKIEGEAEPGQTADKDFGADGEFSQGAEDVHEHEFAEKVVRDATCTEEGLLEYTCACGYSYTASIPVKEHTEGEWKIIAEATITENGLQEKHCTECGELLATEALPMIPCEHDWEELVLTAPTCEAAGEILLTCAVCGSEKWQKTPATGHDYQPDHTTNPTCSSVGHIYSKCAHCGDIVETGTIAALAHSYGGWKETKTATCTENGSEERICSVCGHKDARVISAKGHSESNVTIVKEATCEEDGLKTYTCTVCDESVEEVIPATGHSYTKVETRPTCTEKGYTTYTCGKCGHSYEDDYINAWGHLESDIWVIDKAATCTEKGSKHTKCMDCGETVTMEEIPTLGHKMVEVIDREPTCALEGEKHMECQREGCTYKEAAESIPKTEDHKWGEWEVTTPATEEAEGEKKRTCEVCGKTETETIPKLEHVHSYETTVTAPTCTEKGYTAYTCKCGDSYQDTYVDATGHAYTDTVVAPTCIKDGYTIHRCATCGDTYQDSPKEALKHDLQEVIDVQATCGTDGEKHLECQREGCTYKEEPVTIPMTNEHTWGDWETITEATEESEGLEKHTCLVCNKEEERTIPELNHEHDYAFETKVVAPTCTEQGYTEHICKCGDSNKDTYVDAKGHIWGDWVETVPATEEAEGEETRTCTVCDKTETQNIPKLEHQHDFSIRVDAECVEATCAQEGKEVFKCSKCEEKHTETIEKKEHVPSDGMTMIKEPTCQEEGLAYTTCLECGEKLSEEILPKEDCYVLDWTTVEPDCENAGYKTGICEWCGGEVREEIPALEHNYTTKPYTPPTCMEQGCSTRVCTRCQKEEKYDFVAALGHDLVEVIDKEATCGEDGSKHEACKRDGCQYRKEAVLIPKTNNHKWSEWALAEDGHSHTCSECHQAETEEHSYEDTVVEPTCTTDGYTLHHCTICGHEYTDSEVPAGGSHDYQWVTTKEPALGVYGEESNQCANCGHVAETRQTAMLETDGVDTVYHFTDKDGKEVLVIGHFVDDELNEALFNGINAYRASKGENLSELVHGDEAFKEFTATRAIEAAYTGDHVHIDGSTTGIGTTYGECLISGVREADWQDAGMTMDEYMLHLWKTHTDYEGGPLTHEGLLVDIFATTMETKMFARLVPGLDHKVYTYSAIYNYTKR